MMALKKAYTIVDETGKSTGVTLDDAYHRINFLVLDCDNETAQFTVVIYRDASARAAGEARISMRSFGFGNESEDKSPVAEGQSFDERMSAKALDAKGKNPTSQAYGWLKRHPLYQDASDA